MDFVLFEKIWAAVCDLVVKIADIFGIVIGEDKITKK